MNIVELTPTSLGHLVSQLQQILQLCNLHKTTGFDPYTPYFHYIYYKGEDIGHSIISCPICRGFAETREFSGYQIPGDFPDISQINNIRFYPDVHTTHPEMRSKCGCEMDLVDLSAGCAESLADEMRMSVI